MTFLGFCDYRKVGLGLCGAVAVKDKRCEKHYGLVSKVKIASPKFRGNSEWQKEQGKFKSTVE